MEAAPPQPGRGLLDDEWRGNRICGTWKIGYQLRLSSTMIQVLDMDERELMEDFVSVDGKVSAGSGEVG